MDRIPKQIEQYQTENAKLEKDLPTLREIVGGTWKKEDELKELKSEVATLERKIQLALTPPQQSNKDDTERQEVKTDSSIGNENNQFTKDHIIIARPQPPTVEVSIGFKRFQNLTTMRVIRDGAPLSILNDINKKCE